MGHALIVDEDTSLLELSKAILAREGYQTRTARGGEEAINAVRTHHPDVIIVNDLLSQISGQEICQRIKCDPHLAGIRVILVSARDRLTDKTSLHDSGADAVLFKPYRPTELLQAVGVGSS